VEKLLAQAQQVVDEAEVFTISAEETPVQFENNRLKSIQTKHSCSIALRVIKNGRVGYATSTMIDDYQQLIDNAVSTAEFGTEAKFELPPLTSYPRVDIYDDEVKTVPIEKMVSIGEDMITKVLSHTSDIMCEAEVIRALVTVELLNSLKGKARYQQSIFAMGVAGQLIHDTDMLFVGESDSSCRALTDTSHIIREVTQQLEMAKQLATIQSKPMPVIFTPNGFASAFTPPLMSAFNGKTVLLGASPIGNRLNEQVFDKNLSLWDDSTVPFRPSSRPCDDEGVVSQRTQLIKDGIVNGFLYDLQTAALSGTSSTGNGRRRQGGLPAPAANAFVFTAGKTTYQEMVRDIKEGLVVEQLMGASQGNVLGGDFSGNVILGYKIENGKITGRVKNTMVTGNIYEILNNIVAIGNDSRWIGSSLRTPSFYFSNVSVASK